MQELEKIEQSGQQVDEMVKNILGTITVDLDNYLTKVRACFLNEAEIPDADLDKIVLQIPVYLYPLIVFSQQIEMRKGLAKEQASYTKNDVLLSATGTVQQKEAYAENQTIQDRMIQLAYTTAASIVSKKIDGAVSILESTRKVQQRRMKEKSLTNIAGNAVGAF